MQNLDVNLLNGTTEIKTKFLGLKSVRYAKLERIANIVKNGCENIGIVFMFFTLIGSLERQN